MGTYIAALLWFCLIVVLALSKIPVLDLAWPEIARNSGITGLYLLMATFIPGLVAEVAPRAQLTAVLVRMRRAVGLSALGFVLVHVLIDFFKAFDASFLRIGHLMFPYSLGVALGVVAFIGLIAMGLTANDRAVRALGKRWKQLHRLTYLFTPAALLHALYIGSDFVQKQRVLGVATVIIALILTLLKVIVTARQLGRRPVQPSVVQVVAEKILLVGIVAFACYIAYASLVSGSIGHQHP